MPIDFQILKSKAANILLAIIATTVLSCNFGKSKDNGATRESSKKKIDTSQASSIVLKDAHIGQDTAYGKYLTDKLKPIQANFKRINSIVEWTSTTKKELDGSTQGGEVIFYKANGVLEKVVTHRFGETFQQSSTYYLLNGQLSFVFEKNLAYNRPVYVDSTYLEEHNDNQVFDIEKSKIEEVRSYFKKGKLIHQGSNQEVTTPLTLGYLLKEQKRLNSNFNEMRMLITPKSD